MISGRGLGFHGFWRALVIGAVDSGYGRVSGGGRASTSQAVDVAKDSGGTVEAAEASGRQ